MWEVPRSLPMGKQFLPIKKNCQNWPKDSRMETNLKQFLMLEQTVTGLDGKFTSLRAHLVQL